MQVIYGNTEVTESFKKTFLKDGTIIIPKRTNFNQVFGDPLFGIPKTLTINYLNKVHHLSEDCAQDQKLIIKKYTHGILNDTLYNTISPDKTLEFEIVYFINGLVNKNYLSWLNQLHWIKHWGAKIHIVATIHSEDKTTFTNLVNNLLKLESLTITHTNQFEYPGILKVWEIAQVTTNRHTIILYFHSKGVTRQSKYVAPTEEIVRFKPKEIAPWERILLDIGYIREIFDLFPQIDKVGSTTGGIGWCWFNFWFSRCSYLNQVEKPIITNTRHYYEDWLARKVPDRQYLIPLDNINRPHSFYPDTRYSCYNLHRNGITAKNYEPHEALGV